MHLILKNRSLDSSTKNMSKNLTKIGRIRQKNTECKMENKLYIMHNTNNSLKKNVNLQSDLSSIEVDA